MSKAFARGACPGLSAPMSTGDGLLVRLVVAGPMPLDAFVGLCDAARMHGNGIMEISARGSLQVRGLNAVSAPLFAAAVEALGIDLCESVPVLCRSAARRPHRSDRLAGDRRGAASRHRRGRARAGAESLRGDRRRRAHRSRRGSRRYPAARHPDQRRSKTSCRTRRRRLERDGSRRHRPARRGRCRAGFALDHRRHGHGGARRRSAAAA